MGSIPVNDSIVVSFFNTTAFHTAVVVLIISFVLVMGYLLLRNVTRLFWTTAIVACVLFVFVVMVNVATLSLENASSHWAKTFVTEVHGIMRFIFVPIETFVFSEVKLDEL